MKKTSGSKKTFMAAKDVNQTRMSEERRHKNNSSPLCSVCKVWRMVEHQHQAYGIAMTISPVSHGMCFSNRLGKVQMGRADTAVIICFLQAWLMDKKWSALFQACFEMHIS